ncbi:MAG: DUF3326 domain-containing protein [Candidatus Sericytochromatia bacterium]|nr:DUF3326 domain-containing protein [Candidatus Sericytochromatia bacterium]
MFTAVHLIPTGVGAAIGGYAGDGGPAAALLAAVCDRLVTHPNAVNGAQLLALPPNGLYVEGSALDGWLAGRLALRPVRARKIGILVDRAVEGHPAGSLEALHHAADAVRSVHGVPLAGWTLTPRPIGVRLATGAHGHSTGAVEDPEAVLAGARTLVAAGAEAIAIVADLGRLDPAAEATYDQGGGVDPIGGVEAILSHLVVASLGIPAAHAPLWPHDPAPPHPVDPRAAAEHLGHTFLPCVLMGLARHPSLVAPPDCQPGDVLPGAADAVVVPQGCLGGPGVLAARDRGVPVVVVRENRTAVPLEASALGWEPGAGLHEVANYWEAAGLLACWRAGLDPWSVRRPLPALRRL